MNFFTRLSNGWKISMSSLTVLRKNKQLIIFPLLSGISLVLVMASFVVISLSSYGWDIDAISESENANVIYIVLTFLFYLVNYFIVVFFNMALIHCTHLYFKGEEVSISKGLQFSMSRIGVIFSWALFAATVGTILKYIQENTGIVGRIITGLLGLVWNVATFFVVPVIAYEKVGPIDAFKRSAKMMKEKWGESLGSSFSFGLVQFIAVLVISVPLFFLGSLVHPFAGITLALLSFFVIMAIVSAAQTIFISAVYHNVTGDPVEHVNQQLVDSLFVHK